MTETNSDCGLMKHAQEEIKELKNLMNTSADIRMDL